MGRIFGMTDPSKPLNIAGDNTYIGERYVPIFADPVEWSKASTYEPLTIVTNGGNSYTSKKYVPANTVEINNTEYWAPTGNFNAQLEQYRMEVQELNQNVTKLQTTVTEVDAEVDKIADVTFGDGEQNILITDSYGFNDDGTSWVDIIKQTAFGKTIISKALGGQGFVAGDKQFIGMLKETSADPNKVKRVVVVGGYNDYWHTTTEILDAIKSFVDYVNSTYPKATTMIAFVGWGKTISFHSKLIKAAKAYSQCGLHGGVFINNSPYILRNYNYFNQSDDSFHPNQLGHNALARYLYTGILTGSCNVICEYTTCSFNAADGMSGPTTNIAGYQENNVNVLFGLTSSYNFTKNNTINMNGTTKLVLGTFKEGLIFGDANGFNAVPVTVVYKPEGKTYRQCGGTIAWVNGEIRLYLMDVEDDGSTWRTATITQANVLGWSATISSDVC